MSTTQTPPMPHPATQQPAPAAPHLPPLGHDVPAGRLPRWDTRQLVHRACPACRADQPAPWCVRPDQLTVARCAACGMFYLADIPAAEQIAQFYADYGAFKSYRPTRFSDRLARRLGAADAQVCQLRETGGLAGCDLLEVGCSHGHFLQLVRAAGARVTGLEPDLASRAFAGALGFPLLDELPAAPAFDIVCAFQVLEHLADPDAWVAQVARALRPGGRLLLALPNGGESDRVGPWWIGFRVDLEHFNYFSAATLSRLLARHGLLVERDWLSGQPHLHPTERPCFSARAAERLRALLGLATRQPGPPAPRDGAFVLSLLARRT
jgi:SAM-dependent methyltransferase